MRQGEKAGLTAARPAADRAAGTGRKTAAQTACVAYRGAHTCTLQHALKLNGATERLLQSFGYQLSTVGEGHLCCGSAGTYSILQPAISKQLRQRKLHALKADHPDLIVSANIGCLMHLGEADGIPVKHWLNVVAEDLQS